MDSQLRPTLVSASPGRVYVLAAYLPRGGPFMMYHLARILHLDFGADVTVVRWGTETPDNGLFQYDVRFPTISLAQLEDVVSRADILLCSEGCSALNFGLRFNCFKVMYVNAFCTFKLLDCFCDQYISASGFVRNFLTMTYGFETAVIPPFIEVERHAPAPPWDERPAGSVAVKMKNLAEDGGQQQFLLARFRDILAARAPDVANIIDWEQADYLASGDLPQGALLKHIGAARYFLSLSAVEGFGLTQLEAMALGSTVVGFDAMGCRHYMRPGVNCAVRPYPDLCGVADALVTVMRNPAYGAELAQSGKQTAAEYSYERFRSAWIAELERALEKRRALLA